MQSDSKPNWFERLVGFREMDYADTQIRLEVQGNRLRSLVNHRSYGIGQLEILSLQNLRERVSLTGGRGRLSVHALQGDVRRLHRAPQFAGALFQVASQFNLLEMTDPEVTPELGVTRYQDDATQGPACAIAAGAATLYRHYLAPVGTQRGQTRDRQIDCLAGIGEAFAGVLDTSVGALWTMRNGYAQCSRAGLEIISQWIDAASAEEIDAMRARMCIGLQWDVEVTDAEGPVPPVVSQAFCSALPVAYDRKLPQDLWRQFAVLVLEAAYEATLWGAVCNAQRGVSNVVLLTRLGGGAFGNSPEWIQGALRRALRLVSGFDLDVRLVSYGTPSAETLQLVTESG